MIPLVFVPLGGISDPGVVRDAYDLDAWIMSSPLGPGVRLWAARAALWDTVREVGGGPPFWEVSLSPHKLPEPAKKDLCVGEH